MVALSGDDNEGKASSLIALVDDDRDLVTKLGAEVLKGGTPYLPGDWSSSPPVWVTKSSALELEATEVKTGDWSTDDEVNSPYVEPSRRVVTTSFSVEPELGAARE
jgi:hypothetical protein